MGASSSPEMFTVVENISGAPRTFGYLGPRGMRLGTDEVAAIPGDLISTLGAQTSRRKFDALQRSQRNGTLRVRSTPSPILWDAVNEESKALAVQGGVLGLVDPTFTLSESAGFDYADLAHH